jgi:hypothetical protein
LRFGAEPGRAVAGGAVRSVDGDPAASRGTTLREPVAVAARVLAPHAVAFGHQRLRDDVVEERAVVAHQQQRARVRLQRLLQELERFDIEVVGRLVEHEQVGGPGEQPREQQAIALAAESVATGACARSGGNRKSPRYDSA